MTSALYRKNKRLRNANQLIKAIADCGHKHFHNTETGFTACFDVDERGHVWFIDHYKQKRIYTHYKGHWKDFTQGGTMKRMVRDLAKYISKGGVCPNHFGPWPEECCGGDLWGYGYENMEMIRQTAKKLNIIKEH